MSLRVCLEFVIVEKRNAEVQTSVHHPDSTMTFTVLRRIKTDFVTPKLYRLLGRNFIHCTSAPAAASGGLKISKSGTSSPHTLTIRQGPPGRCNHASHGAGAAPIPLPRAHAGRGACRLARLACLPACLLASVPAPAPAASRRQPRSPRRMAAWDAMREGARLSATRAPGRARVEPSRASC